jgi:hypothetical protein
MRNWSDLEWNDCGIIEVQHGIFPEGPRKNIESSFCFPAEIQTEYHPNARLEQYGYTKLFGALHKRNINNIIILLFVII